MGSLFKLLFIAALGIGLATAIFLFKFPQQIELNQPVAENPAPQAVPVESVELPSIPEPDVPPEALIAEPSAATGDLAPQAQLAEPPKAVKGIYVTGWIAGYKARMGPLIKLIDQTELNAVVIDVKDFSGYVSYRMNVPEVKAAGADKQPRMAYPNRLIKELHDHGIYVIGRVSVFQDSIFARAHPEWAVQDGQGNIWGDRKGLGWMDPASEDVWAYAAAIAKDSFARGFDEIQFDYVRFPSDGNLGTMKFPVYDGVTPKQEILAKFFKYMREALPERKISADLFGLTTVAYDDLGIGQKMEKAYGSFDFLSPMVYPSHYSNGFQGYKNPAKYPFEVIDYSLQSAAVRLTRLEHATSGKAAVFDTKLRPWLQAFDLGAVYTSDMIQAEIRAADKLAQDYPDLYGGWLLWDPNNRYLNYK